MKKIVTIELSKGLRLRLQCDKCGGAAVISRNGAASGKCAYCSQEFPELEANAVVKALNALRTKLEETDKPVRALFEMDPDPKEEGEAVFVPLD